MSYFLNRVPYKKIEKKTLMSYGEKKPNPKYLKVCGCLIKVNILINKKRKIRPKIVNCLLGIFCIVLLIDSWLLNLYMA